MKVAQLLAQKSAPPSGYDPHYFRARKPDGTEQELCRGSFIFDKEYDEILQMTPDILTWEVTAEYLPNDRK